MISFQSLIQDGSQSRVISIAIGVVRPDVPPQVIGCWILILELLTWAEWTNHQDLVRNPASRQKWIAAPRMNSYVAIQEVAGGQRRSNAFLNRTLVRVGAQAVLWI